ncbi:type I-B CRISPR-associated protein Cas5 [Coprothermobacteraceae bacterium]|nr:type I-B CRISPR-associated protein Cas5 [Coprothermobacteraceae bacterium]
MAVVVFDLWGDFGLFRKFYTNTSMLTYPFPPPTAVRGIVGAILGLRRNEYVRALEKMECAISILNPVRKTRSTLNYINTKDRSFDLRGGRTQIPCELIRDAYFRIYVKGLSPLLEDELVKYLSEHRCFFVPYLGMSEFLANFRFVDRVEEQEGFGEAEVASVVPLAKADIILKPGLRLAKERIPVSIDENRSVTQYADVVYEETGQRIPIRAQFVTLAGTHVVFI